MQQSASSAVEATRRTTTETPGVGGPPAAAQGPIDPPVGSAGLWSWKADGAVAALVFAFGAVFWLPYAVHAYFLLDDFSMIEHYKLGTWLPTYRPTFKLAMTVAYWLFGQNAIGYYVLLAFFAAAVGVSMYVALRFLGLSRVPSAIAALGVLIYPRADSMDLWWSNPSALALVLGLGSVALGAAWTHRSGHALRWLVPSLVLLAASVLCYESLAPIFLLYLCFLPLSPNVRRSLVITGSSILVSGLSALYIFDSEASDRQPLAVSQYFHHARLLLTSSWQAFVVHGFNNPTEVGAAFVVCFLVLLVAVLVFAGRSAVETFEPWKRLALTLLLLIVAVPLSLVPFVPSNDYYEPTLLTTGNRVNSLPQVFILAALAIVIWLVARGLTTWWPSIRPVAVPAGLATLFVLLLFSGFAGQVKEDQSYYNAASSLRRGYIAAIRQTKPTAPPGSEIVLANFTEVIGPAADRWYATIYDQWDATAITNLLYRTATIVAAPMDRGSICKRATLAIPLYGLDIPYGKLTVVDVGARRVVRLTDQAECTATLKSLLVTPALD